MPPINRSKKINRPSRIRVPNRERAIFTVDNQKFVGIIQRLSETGGSALLVKGPIPKGAFAVLELRTVFGKVSAQIEFLHTGADGVPLAQAFRFLAMDPLSTHRFTEAAKQMREAGFADVEPRKTPMEGAIQGWERLRDSIRQLADAVSSTRSSRKRNADSKLPRTSVDVPETS